MIIYLLNRLKDFDEFGQSVILNLVAKYTPRKDEELFDILVTPSIFLPNFFLKEHFRQGVKAL